MPVNLILAPAELRHPQFIMGSTAVLRLLLLSGYVQDHAWSRVLTLLDHLMTLDPQGCNSIDI